MSNLIFKVADQEDEFEQIHRLNHDTFAGEIPQHAPHPDGRLVDKFHDENTYIVAKNGEEVVGMICGRGNRPFSLDSKIPNLDEYLPKDRKVCEVRLLAVKKGWRSGPILPGLLLGIWRVCGGQQGYDHVIMSGTTRQLKMYRRLGFKPFGPLVGTPGAYYQPMELTYESWNAAREAMAVLAGEPELM